MMKSNAIKVATLIAAILCSGIVSARYASAQNAVQPVEVVYEYHHDTSLALRDMFPAAYHDMANRQAAENSAAASLIDAELSPTAGLATLTTVRNFDGISHTGWSSPDTNGAVGATQFVQWVNTQYAVYSKSTGAKIFGPAQGSTIFSGFGGLCPTSKGRRTIAQYHKAAGRPSISPPPGQPRRPPFHSFAATYT